VFHVTLFLYRPQRIPIGAVGDTNSVPCAYWDPSQPGRPDLAVGSPTEFS